MNTLSMMIVSPPIILLQPHVGGYPHIMIPTQNDSVPTDVLYENNDGLRSNLYCLTILMDFIEYHGFISPCSVPSTKVVCY